MPFIPKDIVEIGQWVYLKVPIETEAGTFTEGTRVLLKRATGACFDFDDGYGNCAILVHKSKFTQEMPT